MASRKRSHALSFLLSACVAAACATPPTYITKHGLRVHCESDCIEQAQVEIAIDGVVAEMEDQIGDIRDRSQILDRMREQSDWHKLEVVAVKYGAIGSCPIESNPDRQCAGFQCSGSAESGWCMGVTKKDVSNGRRAYTMRVANSHHCAANTTLVHELLHFMQGMLWNVSDNEHAIYPYWRNACDTYDDDSERYVCIVSSIETKAEGYTRDMNPDHCDI